MSGVYDREEFFEGYKKIRGNPYSANAIIETPNLFGMLPDVACKRILDLGCGVGGNCQTLINMGAKEVIGIDCSENMLGLTKRKEKNNLHFINHDIEELGSLADELGKFDIIISSLAMHYIEDYAELAKTMHNLLNDGGVLLFSQEHPIFTASKETAQWISDGNGGIKGLIVNGYPDSGIRCVNWIVDDFVKYHRTFSDVINPLIQCDFEIQEIREPSIDPKWCKKDIALSRNLQVPDYLFVKAKKVTK